MRFIPDHDYHIHSKLSLCSNDPKQSSEAILRFAKQNGFKKICLTDHYWDETAQKACPEPFYDAQDTAHISAALPLPTDSDIAFHFGAEVEMDKRFTIGIGDKMLDKLDFIVVPTTHLHFVGFTIDEKDTTLERRAEQFVKRFDKLLSADLPFEKIGLAHITCPLMAPGDFQNHLTVLDMVDDKTFEELFTRAAKCGMGVEINFEPNNYTGDDAARVKRPYLIAEKCGCKFYMATDAHHNDALENAKADFERRVDFLGLKEEQKFKPFG